MNKNLQLLEIFPSPIFSKFTDELNNELFCKTIYQIQQEELDSGEVKPSISSIGGYHTGIIKDRPEFSPLKNFILDTLNTEILNGHWYQGADINEDCFSNMWAIINKKGHGNSTHNHANSWFSGAYYAKVPLDAKKAGGLCFKDPVQARQFTQNYYKTVQNEMYCIAPQTGKLVLFPGWLEHSVKANKTSEDRIVISFNISKP